MSKKIYKTAKGSTLDMGALRLQNEKIRAVGNMGVNARGDRIDAQGNVIDSANQQLKRRIQRQTNVSAGPVHTSQQAVIPTPISTVDTLEDDIGGPMDTPLIATTEPTSGLAGAIARSKATKTETKKS